MSILVATDLSENSRQALRWASTLAASRKVPLLVVHVIETLGDSEIWTALFETPEEIEARVLKTGSQKVREFARETLQGIAQPDERKILVSVGAIAEEIDRFANRFDAQLVVSGTTGHGAIHNVLLGSTARRLTQSTRRPTAFVPPDAALPPPRRIIVGVDFSACSEAALRWISRQAAEWGANVTAVHGLGVSALSPDYEPSANFVPMVDTIVEQRQNEVRSRMNELGVEGEVIVDRGAPADAIVAAAQETGANLVVMGTHGRGAFGRLVLGSVASRVLRRPPCAVVTIHDEAP